MKIWASLVLTTSLLGSGSGILRAQTRPISTLVSPSTKPNYDGESFILDQLTRIYTYAADGTGTEEVTGIVEIRNQAAVKALSVLPFNFASNSEHVEIDYVRVHHTDGTVVTTPVTDAQELPDEVTREAPFYSDLKQEQIPVRSLREGDHLEYKVRIIRTKAEAPGHFWGAETFFAPSNGAVVLSEIVELHVPKSSFVQVWSPKVKPAVTEVTTDGVVQRVYHWQSAQLTPVAGKDKNDLLRMDNDPALGTSDDPRLPTISWTNFHSWAEVGAWYRSLEGSRTEPNADVRAKVATLIAGKSTEDDKARAIYAYVSEQVRYIGVAFGVGRFQPHEAGDVLSNQYGDCKDKSTLLISMLSAAGIPADTVLIGQGLPFNPAVPSPGSFNHAITRAHVDGKLIWLDSTAEVAPYRLLNFYIRGKEALVIPSTGEAQVDVTPKDPPFPFENHYEAIGTLDDTGTSHSHITMDFRGDDEIAFRQGVRSVSPAQWDQLMQNISQAMQFGGKVTNTQFSKPDDTTGPFRVTYDYEREKNGDWDNLRILAQLTPVGLGDIDEKNPPATPIELGDPHTEIDHAEMTLPKGWHANLPPSVHAKSSFAAIDITYKFENNILTTDRRIQIFKKNIPATDWPAYHQWISDAKVNTENYIQLVNAPLPTGTSSYEPPLKGSTNPGAAELIRQAVQAEHRNDWVDVKTKLDEAQKQSPSQPFLWSNYGYVALHIGDIQKAIEDYKLELTINPDEPNVSRLLASAYMRQQRYDEAVTTLQTALALNPTDEPAILYLSFILVQHGDYASAERALRSGLAAKPDNLNFKVRLGIALLHEQKNEEGEALILDVLAKSDDPSQLNDAAYSIADATLDLPLAEKYSSRSLELLDQATNNGETGPNALRRANLLVAAWDTYGWILFREGKISEAEPWVRAAWRNGNGAESGYHLAIILDKEDHPTQALAQLDLAAAGEPGTNAAAVYKLISDKRSGLLSTNGLSARAVSPAKDAHISLQEQRKYDMPSGGFKPTGQGWAKVELEITPQRIAAFRIVQGDQTLQTLSTTVQHLNLDLQLPSESHAILLRSGVLNCQTATTCQLVLATPRSALEN